MHVQIVMDRTGDARHEFDPTEASSSSKAEHRFQELIGEGYSAVAFAAGDTSGKRIVSFDPEAERTVFIPRLVGG